MKALLAIVSAEEPDVPRAAPKKVLRWSLKKLAWLFRRVGPPASVAWLYHTMELTSVKDDIGWLRRTIVVAGPDGPEEWVAEIPVLTIQIKAVGDARVLEAQAVIMPPTVRRVLPLHEVIRVPVARMIAIEEKVHEAITSAKAKEARELATLIANWRRQD